MVAPPGALRREEGRAMSKSATSKMSASRAKIVLAQLNDLSAEQLAHRVIERRAFEAVVWGMPAVNFELMYQAMADAGGDWNQIVYWSRLPGWKNQTLTPNPDVIYLMPFFDTNDGPVVLEIPPADGGSITGSIDDAWQAALEDVGPAGLDKGKGGKYLILPPGHVDKVPSGYIVLQSDTYRGFALLRSNLEGTSEADVAKAVAYGKRVKLTPLSKPARETVFIDAIDDLFDATITYDVRFFEMLHRFVQHEPWLLRDKAMIDSLKSIGIEKDEPFEPDKETRYILIDAVQEARAWLDIQYELGFATPYFDHEHWSIPVIPEVIEGAQTLYADPNIYPLDGRAATYSMAFFSAKHLGAGQYCLMTIRDKAGEAFDGRHAYHLHVPADVPVDLYWSAVRYDRATHALIRDMAWSSRSSHTASLQTNLDGSVDLYFGPKAPVGKDANWIPTNPHGLFEVLFRFHGPKKPLFDKTWVLPDIEKIG
jgi:hypothetical protein